MFEKLKGHGPSNVVIVARKYFPFEEEDRCYRERCKIIDLKILGDECKLFKVPECLGSTRFTYDMEYIKGAVELGEIGYKYKSSDLRDRILNLIDALKNYKSSAGEIWPVMIEKFNQLRTKNKTYNELIIDLPPKMQFPDYCYGYCHGDLTFDNILVTPNDNWYLIDPVWSKVDSPLWDVGKICQSILVGWKQIKETGGIGYKDGWISALCYSASGHASQSLLDALVQKYSYNGVVLSTACQLSRVARWCFSDALIPVINELLTRFFSKDSEESKISALPSLIERMLV